MNNETIIDSIAKNLLAGAELTATEAAYLKERGMGAWKTDDGKVFIETYEKVGQ